MNEQLKQAIKDFRKRLHQIPEIGYEEVKTSAYIKSVLQSYGYTIHEVAKTGVVAVKKGELNKAIAFRADMDGLRVEEKTGIDYQSKHLGFMHACGHDGHMAILLGLAAYLSDLSLKQDVVFIFQPAEEGPGGAKAIIDEGVFTKYNIQQVFGLHLYPGIDEGKVGLLSGPMMAKAGEFDIEITAKSSHGAMPQNGIDGILIASQLISTYQSIISRNIEPIEGAILTIGKIEGGEARNVIAHSVRLEGTIRAFRHEVYDTIKDRINEINHGLENMYGIKIKTEIRDLYPPVINDESLYEVVNSLLKEDEKVLLKPMMIAEDFSYYQEVTGGFFMMLGTKNEDLGFNHPLHSCYFNFNEDVLIQGVELFLKICNHYHIIKG